MSTIPATGEVSRSSEDGFRSQDRRLEVDTAPKLGHKRSHPYLFIFPINRLLSSERPLPSPFPVERVLKSEF